MATSGLSGLSVPSTDPLAAQVLAAATGLETQTEQDQLAELAVQSQIEALNTENSIRMAIAAAMHAIANQAISLSQQFIGDEISQTKKGNENASKAV